MNLPAYPKYKPSGVEWLGDVPEGWSFERLRFSIISNPVKSEVLNWDYDTLISFVPMEAVGEYGGIDLSKEKAIGEVYNGYTYFANDDVVIAKITPCFENGKGAIAHNLTNGVAFGTTEFHVVRPLKDISQRWIFYLTISHGFRNGGASEMVGAGGQKRVPETFIKDFRTGIPSPAEQQKIANFLDWKTGQIYSLIAKKKLLIEKLKEKRIALITHAVSKGLNPNAKMKDSGIPWLGEVPEHWEVRRLKFHIRSLESGVSVNAEQVPTEDESPAILKTSCVFGNQFRPNENKRTLPEEVYRLTCPVIGDSIIISRMNTPALVGHCGYVDKDHPNLFLPDRLWISRFWYNFEGSVKFFWYYLSSKSAQGITEFLATGASGSMKNLTQDDYLCIHVPTPSRAEQYEIVNELDKKCECLEKTINKTQAIIEKLTEYRTALITAATTGKIDVRGVKIPQGASQ